MNSTDKSWINYLNRINSLKCNSKKKLKIVISKHYRLKNSSTRFNSSRKNYKKRIVKKRKYLIKSIEILVKHFLTGNIWILVVSDQTMG